MATTNLDYFIAGALKRKEEREEATRLEDARRRMEIVGQMIDQLGREMQRAIPADILDALGYDFRTQDVYPQCYALFTVRDVVLHLWYTEQRNAQEWHLSRPGTRDLRNTIGRVIQEQVYADKQVFHDALLCAISELTNTLS